MQGSPETFFRPLRAPDQGRPSVCRSGSKANRHLLLLPRSRKTRLKEAIDVVEGIFGQEIPHIVDFYRLVMGCLLIFLLPVFVWMPIPHCFAEESFTCPARRRLGAIVLDSH